MTALCSQRGPALTLEKRCAKYVTQVAVDGIQWQTVARPVDTLSAPIMADEDSIARIGHRRSIPRAGSLGTLHAQPRQVRKQACSDTLANSYLAELTPPCVVACADGFSFWSPPCVGRAYERRQQASRAWRSGKKRAKKTINAPQNKLGEPNCAKQPLTEFGNLWRDIMKDNKRAGCIPLESPLRFHEHARTAQRCHGGARAAARQRAAAVLLISSNPLKT